MTLPKPDLPKHQDQIVDEATGEADRFDPREPEHPRMQEDAWVKNFIGRLAGVLRNISKK